MYEWPVNTEQDRDNYIKIIKAYSVFLQEKSASMENQDGALKQKIQDAEKKAVRILIFRHSRVN